VVLWHHAVGVATLVRLILTGQVVADPTFQLL
jgi:hypothetical protein